MVSVNKVAVASGAYDVNRDDVSDLVRRAARSILAQVTSRPGHGSDPQDSAGTQATEPALRTAAGEQAAMSAGLEISAIELEPPGHASTGASVTVAAPKELKRDMSVLASAMQPRPTPGRLSVSRQSGLVRAWREAISLEQTRSRLKDYWSPRRRAIAQRWGRYATYAFAGWFAVVGLLTIVYRFVDPPFSNLMLYNYLTGSDVHRTWVPLDNISSHVIKAVIVAEDARFCSHWGIDFAAIESAIENATDGYPRGASTISMQTAKNMFLWNSRSYVRKVLEVPVTIVMELVWPKRRMLEVYLNIVEWGPGVFGIGAAARHHFKTSASNIGPRAAAQLAAALPNPIVRSAGRPGPRTRRKANVVQARARNGARYAACVL